MEKEEGLEGKQANFFVLFRKNCPPDLSRLGHSVYYQISGSVAFLPKYVLQPL